MLKGRGSSIFMYHETQQAPVPKKRTGKGIGKRLGECKKERFPRGFFWGGWVELE